MAFRHELRVRYAEVDMQGHVFNAHYLTYADEACDAWFRQSLGEDYDDEFQMVLKRADITWQRRATFGDVLTIDVAVRRWGTTSMEVGYQGAVGERPVFEAVVTYVAVAPDVAETGPTAIAMPDQIRAALA